MTMRLKLTMFKLMLVLTVMAVVAQPAKAARIKEVATVQGVRPNSLVGYGLVVGLDGTGDQTTQTPFTGQSCMPCCRKWA